MTPRDELLDARLRELLVERAAQIERQAIDEEAMTARLLAVLSAHPSVFARPEPRTALRLLLVAALVAALLGLVAFVAAPRPHPLGNGPISWASGTAVLSVSGPGASPTAIGPGPSVDPGTRCCSLAWNPDGSRLAASSDAELVILDRAGRRTVPAPDLEVRGTPAWSPDGTRLAVPAIVHNTTHVFVVDLLAGTERRIDGDLAVSAGPSWSPDGRSIAFGGAMTETAPAQQGAPGVDVWSLYVAPADGSDAPHVLATGLPAGWVNLAQVLMAQAPAWGTSWSPDGSRIVFQAKTADCCGYRIYVVAAGGGSAHPLTPESAIGTNPQWSPDGSRVAYASWSARLSPPIDLVVLDLSGVEAGRSTVVAHDVDPWDIAWSPDGSWLAYGHGETGQILTAAQSFADIWMVRPDGSEPTHVATGPFEGGLAWQPLAR